MPGFWYFLLLTVNRKRKPCHRTFVAPPVLFTPTEMRRKQKINIVGVWRLILVVSPQSILHLFVLLLCCLLPFLFTVRLQNMATVQQQQMQVGEPVLALPAPPSLTTDATTTTANNNGSDKSATRRTPTDDRRVLTVPLFVFCRIYTVFVLLHLISLLVSGQGQPPTPPSSSSLLLLTYSSSSSNNNHNTNR